MLDQEQVHKAHLDLIITLSSEYGIIDFVILYSIVLKMILY